MDDMGNCFWVLAFGKTMYILKTIKRENNCEAGWKILYVLRLSTDHVLLMTLHMPNFKAASRIDNCKGHVSF